MGVTVGFLFQRARKWHLRWLNSELILTIVMKKTIVTLMMLTGVATAESIGFNEMSSTLQSDISYRLDKLSITSSTDEYWEGDTGTSFTVSFDISNISDVNAGDCIVCLSSNHLEWWYSDGTLQLTLNENGDVVLRNHAGGQKYFDGIVRDTSKDPENYVMGGENATLGLTAAGSLTTVTTITLVSDSEAGTFTMYNNGVEVAKQTGWNPDSGINGMQLGKVFGGGGKNVSGSVDLSNVYVWNRALSSDEVKAVAGIPEPTTATLSLLALAGLCARRRRA